MPCLLKSTIRHGLLWIGCRSVVDRFPSGVSVAKIVVGIGIVGVGGGVVENG